MAADTEWLTYSDAAERLAITRESVRRMSIRKRWAKQKGNDGLARIGIPIETLTKATTGHVAGQTTGHDTRSDAGHVAGQAADDMTSVVPELRGQISQLEARLKATQDELLAMVQRVGASESEVGSVKAMLDEVRSSRDELRQDRDAWRQQAERLTAQDQRPWWRRLAG